MRNQAKMFHANKGWKLAITDFVLAIPFSK